MEAVACHAYAILQVMRTPLDALRRIYFGVGTVRTQPGYLSRSLELQSCLRITIPVQRRPHEVLSTRRGLIASGPREPHLRDTEVDPSGDARHSS